MAFGGGFLFFQLTVSAFASSHRPALSVSKKTCPKVRPRFFEVQTTQEIPTRLSRIYRIMWIHPGTCTGMNPEWQHWESDPGAGSKRPLVVSDHQGDCFCDFQGS